MPTTNPFFSNLTGFSGEQELLDDLVIEQIKIYGVDILYLPRKLATYDRFLNETVKSIFEVALQIPMYVKSYSGYTNGIELLTKFGVRSSDELVMVMSKSQFQAFYTPFIENYYKTVYNNPNYKETTTSLRPKEGDLIYFPFDGAVFEVKYVNTDGEFFKFGKNYVFELQLEKFEYSGEQFNTGIDKVDIVQKNNHYSKMKFTLQNEGVSKFTFNETVKIYNIEDENYELPPIISPDGPQGVVDFNFYSKSGFLEDVPFVSGIVMEWNDIDNTLLVSQLSEQDPIQTENYDDYVNKLSKVLIIGETSGAAYLSTSCEINKDPFDDTQGIQSEFDSIKILDLSDDAPFGFV